eukprot:606801-Pelagomonas_calceolata.AAC.4
MRLSVLYVLSKVDWKSNVDVAHLGVFSMTVKFWNVGGGWLVFRPDGLLCTQVFVNPDKSLPRVKLQRPINWPCYEARSNVFFFLTSIVFRLLCSTLNVPLNASSAWQCLLRLSMPLVPVNASCACQYLLCLPMPLVPQNAVSIAHVLLSLPVAQAGGEDFNVTFRATNNRHDPLGFMLPEFGGSLMHHRLCVADGNSSGVLGSKGYPLWNIGIIGMEPPEACFPSCAKKAKRCLHWPEKKARVECYSQGQNLLCLIEVLIKSPLSPATLCTPTGKAFKRHGLQGCLVQAYTPFEMHPCTSTHPIAARKFISIILEVYTSGFGLGALVIWRALKLHLDLPGCNIDTEL